MHRKVVAEHMLPLGLAQMLAVRIPTMRCLSQSVIDVNAGVLMRLTLAIHVQGGPGTWLFRKEKMLL